MMGRQPQQRLTPAPTGGSQRPSAADLLTLAEVAAATGRNPELLRRWCAAGRIRCHRVGRDWVIQASDVGAVRKMPRRGQAKAAEIALDDLATLPGTLGAQVEARLEPEETVRVVVLGIEGSAIVVTDRKALLARDGALVTQPERGEVAAWRLDRIRRVQLDAGTSGGALVLVPRDADDPALVAVLARTHLERAQAATLAIRELLARVRSHDSH